MLANTNTTPKTPLLVAAALCGALALGGCFEKKKDEDAPKTYGEAIELNLDLPNSLTGGPVAGRSIVPRTILAAASSDQPCAFRGVGDDEDPFRNGYRMTRFMVSAVAAWTCLVDVFFDVAVTVPHDGVIRQTENDKDAAGYDRDDPTHYSVSDDSATQTTIRLYYDYSRAAPPVASSTPGLFVSWNKAASGTVTGRVVVDAVLINGEERDADDPIAMRMDFTFDDSEKVADMYLRFDEGNEWAEGLRIHVANDLDANPLQTVFTARGLMDMKRQFLPVDGVTEFPKLRMYTVSDRVGNGAAIAEFVDVGVGFALNETNNLGDYIFDKTDIYFFDADQDWDYIHKTVSASEFRGNRTTPATGGTWLPFDPSLDLIETELSLGTGYFDTSCATVGDDCSALLNAVFQDGFAGQEPNQGSDPLDWRSTAIASPDYLTTVYPNGVSWDGAFDPSFTP
jgi:hypothetical protein